MQAPGFSQSYNRYAYVFGSPLSYTDPSGYQPKVTFEGGDSKDINLNGFWVEVFNAVDWGMAFPDVPVAGGIGVVTFPVVPNVDGGGGGISGMSVMGVAGGLPDFASAVSVLREKGLIPGEVLDDSSVLVNRTDVDAVWNRDTDRIETMSHAQALELTTKAGSKWSLIEGSTQGG